jgi:DNA-binding SARP family transcriptional activator
LVLFRALVSVGGIVDFRVLGLLEVRDGGRQLGLPRGKERALLALLIAHANGPVSVDRIVEELWAQQPPENAAKAVQTYVSRLRSQLGRERIRTTPAGYQLQAWEDDDIDAECFIRLRNEGHERLDAGDSEGADELLSRALGLWRGQAYADFRFDGFAQGEIHRLEEMRGAAVADRVDARLALGRSEDVIGDLEQLIREQPLWERPRGQMMLALYQTGRQAEALALYRATRTLFAEELGLDPSTELQALERAILNQSPELVKPRAARRVTQHGEREHGVGVFVGRQAELLELVAGLEDALSGHGRVFLVVGEPGIGKSRLADELLRSARDHRAALAVGRCWEAGGAPAFWPWVQVLRAVVHDADARSLREQLGTGAAELAQILPELRDRFPDLLEPLPVDSPAARFRLFDAAAAFLRRSSERQPLVIVVDDLHAADSSSLLLLQFLAREITASHILLLCACRDVDPLPNATLTEVLAEVAREPSTRRLELGGLSELHVAEYVELSAAEIGSPAFLSRLYSETEGNPLFMAETVRLLTLERDGAELTETRLVIPQGVRQAISRRLGHLTKQCAQVLELASVLGREFSPVAVARCAELSEDSLLEMLDEAVSARVVTEVPGTAGRLRFAHVLMRDTLYDAIASTRRVRLHRRALEVLEDLYGAEPGPHLTELLQHAASGRVLKQGIRYAQRAGDRAAALLAYEEAARLYGLGLELLDGSPVPLKDAESELLLGLGHAQTRAGDAAAAKTTFLRASEVARDASLQDALASAALGYGGRFVWARASDDEHVVPLLREALQGRGRDARLLARLAAALGDDPDGEERERLSREAVELARSDGDGSTLAYALVARLSAIWSPAFAAERLAIASELVELVAAIGDKERAVEAHGLRFNALMELCRIEEAFADLAARDRLTNEMGQPAQLWVQLVLETNRSLFVGELEAAERTLSESFELRESRGRAAEPAFELQRFVLRREQGRLAEIEPALERSVADHPKRRVLGCAQANLTAELGRLDVARRHLARLSEQDFAALPLDGDWLVSAAFVAETCNTVGDSEAAAALHRRLLPFVNLNVSGEGEVSLGAVSRYLGHLAQARNEFDEAVRYLERALEENSQMGTRTWLAHTQHDLGELLFERGLHPDQRRARELIDSALASYRDLGIKPRPPWLGGHTAGALVEHVPP